MKQINVWFDNEEHEKILKEKIKTGLSWHDFIIKLVKDNIQKTNQINQKK